MRKYESYIRSSSLIGLDKLQVAGKPSVIELMQTVGLAAESLKKPDMFISYQRFCELLELAAIEWEKPWLGFEFALSLDDSIPTLPGAVLAARLYPDFRSFGKAAMEYWSLHSTASYGILNEDYAPDKVCLRSIMPPYIYRSRQESQSALGQGMRLCRSVLRRPDASPLEIHLAHTKQNVDGFEEVTKKLFDCPVYFDMEFDQIIFHKEMMDWKIAGNISVFSGFLRKFVQKRFDDSNHFESSATRMVLSAIPNFFGTDGCNFVNVASMLNVQPKTLQRLLATEGNNFKDLFLFVRVEKAKELLCTTNLPIEHIAKFLNYVGAAPFSFAFRRETNYSPMEYRKRFAANY
ncbi:AraC family transcriptional regulator [Pseudaquidulcibacter saccharophilus]|uniref:AraC family transcriptional regulator n=1 Tax=Pseudaquidulcibacter saccharophilus TaxID=2831900 RepID=UPI001EFF0A20|nr:AraC family transcriptional regulator ligand-binding domain-containing protein [Pseudaquidulcibacter saccharophilus]